VLLRGLGILIRSWIAELQSRQSYHALRER
jgi:hypothetical protein